MFSNALNFSSFQMMTCSSLSDQEAFYKVPNPDNLGHLGVGLCKEWNVQRQDMSHIL